MDSIIKFAEHKLSEATENGESEMDVAYWTGYADCAKILCKYGTEDTEEVSRAKAWIARELHYLKNAPSLNGCEMKSEWAEQIEVWETALDALKKCVQMQPDRNTPLTIEKLRWMDGKWVNIVLIDGEPKETAWAIVCNGKVTTFLVYGSGKHLLRGEFGIEECGKSFLAYYYPPAHIDRETWTGCVCNNSKKNCCTCISMECHSCIGESKYKQGRYCSSCGRPLTEEAWAELEKRLRG